MRFFIGLDGGGSGSRAQAALADGARTAVLHGGPANVHSDPERALANIRELLERCLQAVADLAPQARRDGAVVVLGLAGASESNAAPMLRAALPWPELQVTGDLDITLAGALQGRAGIVAALGTGSVLARLREGQVQRIGGHGFVLGDEASGAWLGRQALSLALHMHDGLAPQGALGAQLWARFGTVTALLAFARDARPADFATLAPMVLAQDRAGCPQACAILDAACAYLQRAITLLQTGAPALPVVGCGGLGPALLDRLGASVMPGLTRAEPLGSALDGALWLARNMPHPPTGKKP